MVYIKYFKYILIGSLIILTGGEVVCRKVLGLGDPPLYIADSEIEYLLKPNQNLMRFGNEIIVNSWGMRSPEMSSKKNNADELRVLVIGDSVVNGGSQIAQAQLSTSLLQKNYKRL